jgi:hypothetical protein
LLILLQAEENAKRKKLRRWANFVEAVVKVDEQEEEAKDNEAERKVNYEKVSTCSYCFVYLNGETFAFY